MATPPNVNGGWVVADSASPESSAPDWLSVEFVRLRRTKSTLSV
jgi:hypothetical protein